MIFRRPEKTQSDVTATAQRRVHTLPTNEILMWADTAGAAIARSLSDYQRHQDSDSLEDAYSGLLTMLGVLDELRLRKHLLSPEGK